jgi:hypothetical protein
VNSQSDEISAMSGRLVKSIMGVLVAAWLMSGCVSTEPNDALPSIASTDARTGLCNDATPPPCDPPRD